MKYNAEDVYKLKLQTLPVPYLRELCKNNKVDEKGNSAELILRLFSKKIPAPQIDAFIKAVYQKEKDARLFDHTAIKKEVDKLESRVWGVVQGELDAYIQTNYVRKYLHYEDLVQAIQKDFYPAVTSYVLATWFNHWTTIVLEDVIAEQPNVVPTVKSVKGIDLFWLGQPWDLKTTNLPKEWFTDGHTIDHAVENPAEAAEYLYRLQGAQRFGADNRFFVILADKGERPRSRR